MKAPKTVIGVEQVGDRQIEHTVIDRRPIIAMAVWIVFTITALIVAEVTK